MQTNINISLVLEAVRQIGDTFLLHYKKTAIPTDMDSLMDRLNQLDEQCLSSLKANLLPAYQDIPWFVGDEFDKAGQKQPLDLPEYWLCDAMDGAIQYLQHLPGWTINLVLIRQGHPYLSVVYAPLEGELYWAQQGKGAYLNNQPIHPSTKTDPAVMVAVFDYGHQDEAAFAPNLNQQVGTAVTRLLDHVGIVRNYGPHGLQLANVGAGRIDLFYQPGLDTFNWLAGLLIAREAGALVLTTTGQPWQWGDDSLLVAAPSVAKTLLTSLVKDL